MGLASSLLRYLVFLPLRRVSNLSRFGALGRRTGEGRERLYLIDTAVNWMFVLFGLGKRLKLALLRDSFVSSSKTPSPS